RVGRAVLALTRVRHLAAERLRHDLEAVADAERRDAELEDRGVERRRALGVHRRRPAREDDRDGILRAHLVGRDAVWDELAEHTRLADAAGDQLGVLCAEVDDENRSLRGIGAHGAASWRGSVDEDCWAFAARFAAAVFSRSAR